jgi:hypothetical protein
MILILLVLVLVEELPVVQWKCTKKCRYLGTLFTVSSKYYIVSSKSLEPTNVPICKS